MSDEKQALERWHQYTEKACRDLSDQALMERIIVAGLLRVLEIPYEDCEIRKAGKDREPIDVLFKLADQKERVPEARFQVTEILDENRRRDAELCDRVKKLAEAEIIREMYQPVDSLNPTACAPDDYFQLILFHSQKKVKKYGRVAGDIDLLVYINRRSAYLYPIEPWPDPTPLVQHGWRSVAFVDNYSYARVLYANKAAPSFLREATGKTHVRENGPGRSVFPQTLGPQCEPEAKSAQRSRE